jgi:beta-barrel assembly-enhancing protease
VKLLLPRLLPRRQRYFLLAILATLVCTLISPLQAQAQSIWERIFIQGLQVVQLSNISPQQEVSIGQEINQQFLQQGMKLVNDPQINQYVTQIGQRLASSSQRTDLPYTFQIVRDSAVNAYATMGGYVYVTTGLMQTADNEAQLASVIGHEIGHIEGRHLVRQMRQTAVTRGLLSAAGLDRSAAVNIGAELAIRRPRGRQDEFDADQRGLRMITRANYAESAMPSFMQKLVRQGSPPSILSTHPAATDRVVALEAAIRNGQGNGCRPNAASSSASTCGLDTGLYQQSVRARVSNV